MLGHVGAKLGQVGVKMGQHRSKIGQHGAKMGQHSAKMGQHSVKIAQHSAKIAQHSVQEQPQEPKKPSKVLYCRRFFDFRNLFVRSRPKFKKTSPRCSQKCQNGAKMDPRLSNIAQHIAKMGQNSAKMTEHRAKIAEHSVQEQPQDIKKPSKVMYCRRFFGFRLFRARSRPRSKKSYQDAPKSAPSWPS